jgi:hypothetical protein
METKKPINIFNGLQFRLDEQSKEKPKSSLITISAYKNSRNITKPFVKPISKIF